jgi:endonuclease/exonuclease/phosphatase family metal-dependent hydrolase
VEKERQCEVILLGDFNYRIGITEKEYEKMLESKLPNTE